MDKALNKILNEYDIGEMNISNLQYIINEINDKIDAHLYLRSDGQYDTLHPKNILKSAYKDREIAKNEHGESRSSNEPYDRNIYNKIKNYYLTQVNILKKQITKMQMDIV